MEPLASFIWILFLVWSVLVAIIWFGNIGEAELRQWLGGVQSTDPSERMRYPGLFAASVFLLSIADTIWIILGAANVYVSLSMREGLAATRRWGLASLAVFWIVSAVSAWTDWPLGPVHFTNRLGMTLGPVPLGWVLLVFSLVFGARDLALWLARSASHAMVALLSGLLLALSSFPLALVAWKIRAWLIWYPGEIPAPAIPPIQYFISFFILGFACAWFCRNKDVTRSGLPAGKPAAVFLTIIAFLGLLTGATH
jgi:hypothetical protein